MHFALTIFISAFLLFQVQPLIAKYILPWFGGSPAVWSTCMLFFQLGLLIGYTYAHIISSRLTLRWQVQLHFILLIVSLALLPITPSDSLKPTDVDSPALDIIWLLLSTVGIPYILVSATGPLLQHWFGRQYPKKSPYRLYALSNFGSLLGLLTYPFLIEPNFRLAPQTILWSLGYAVFVATCAWAGYTAMKVLGNTTQLTQITKLESPSVKGYQKIDPFLWIAFAACGSVILLSATNFICQDVAVIPFFWVIPLSLYLATFIIAFDSPRWYVRWFWITAFLGLLFPVFSMLDAHYQFDASELSNQVLLYLAAMFTALMICHGELARIKPGNRGLTFFYLMMSFGGALGGAFVTFLAPNIFSDFWEWPISLAAVLTLLAINLYKKPSLDLPKLLAKPLTTLSKKVRTFSKTALPSALFVLSLLFFFEIPNFQKSFSEGVLATNRNFYGVLRVIEDYKGELLHRYGMYHGQIKHGIQLQNPKLYREPTSYYSRKSGVGVAITKHPKRLQDKGLRVAVIGLGAGTIGTYLEENDLFTYYEIDPDVVTFAREYFSYLDDGGDQVELVLGDGRISLERELIQEGSRLYDVIAVDAFSGDAIPVHLLTKEAFELYADHLNEGGILAIHVTNLYLYLEPLVYNLGKSLNMRAINVEADRNGGLGISYSSWVLISNNSTFFEHPDVVNATLEWEEDVLESNILWTDNFSNLMQLLK